jgi:hypothetical protein
MYFQKIFLITLLMSFASTASSETIWCKAMKLGCLTSSEKEKLFEKETQNCVMLANSSYREGLNKALADDTVWQFSGNKSAQDYAQMRKNLMMSICMKSVYKNSP